MPPSSAPRSWRLRTRILTAAVTPRLMGIVNVTPDSFSDGGRFWDPQRAIEHGLRLAAEGADLLDIGGESTRPYSTPVSADEELRRVIPVLTGLRERTDVPLSIDTSKAKVAREALAAGAEVINDVTGLTGDPQMVEVALESSAGVCAMHMQGTPQTMQDHPTYDDVVAEVMQYLRERRDALLAAGVTADRICLDPGVGFGKTHEHNLQLLANAWRFRELGCPVLWGPSRKGFIAKVIGDKQADRLPGTLGVALGLAAQGVEIIRVHDIGPLRQALALFRVTVGVLEFPGTR